MEPLDSIIMAVSMIVTMLSWFLFVSTEWGKKVEIKKTDENVLN